MDLILKRDWWSTLQVAAFCAAMSLVGAIIVGVF